MITIPVTPVQYAALLAEAKKEGSVTILTPASGKMEVDGVQLAWANVNGSVAVTIVKKPFYVTDAEIEAKIKSFLPSTPAAQPLGGPAKPLTSSTVTAQPDWKAKLGLKV